MFQFIKFVFHFYSTAPTIFDVSTAEANVCVNEDRQPVFWLKQTLEI